MNTTCFNCNKAGEALHGYIICDSCKKNLRLFSDKTVEKHVLKFTGLTYQNDIEKKLVLLETDFIKKKIKLLDILNKLEK